ncbi:LysR family transcriptional regulator [Arthrobacter sp. H35-D1]|uniref:LysR family transcriptional regulator n=1 Tax=Arthrobacter sp. H35-D1 TaxID=3046202 RepID=UPI0024BA0EC6|nr:LysR family transcriptional regulator [Arthrobacter sp. H35-D1]MDJ0314028.1 LysR family transcriptional regulator [Arthrobacter sp. H35-D1]
MITRWPDLAALELFVAVAREGSLSAGARAVGMAQPNAGRAMSRLERELGVPLFDRRTSGSRLTDAGGKLLKAATAVVEGARGLLLSSVRLGEVTRGQLSVGASRTVAEYLMPGWLTALKERDPDLKIALVVDNSRHVFEEITHGHIDVGFVESPNVPTGLRRLVVASDRLAVVVAPKHQWARRNTPLAAPDLAQAELVAREPGSGTRTALDRALRGHAQAKPAMELGSNAAVCLAVAAGAGAAVLSEFAVRAQVERGELVEVPVAGVSLTRRIRAVWKGGRGLPGPAGELVNVARAGYHSNR